VGPLLAPCSVGEEGLDPVIERERERERQREREFGGAAGKRMFVNRIISLMTH